MGTVALVAAIVLAVAVLAWMQIRHVQRVRAERARLLLPAEHLLLDARPVRRGLGFPVIDGTYRGRDVRVQALPDHVGLRERPWLWLTVSTYQPLPIPAPLEVTFRPLLGQTMSVGERFPYTTPPAAAWGEDTRVKSRLPVQRELVTALARLPVFGDPRVKSVLVTPKGVRVVYELTRAEMSLYRFTRRVKFVCETTEDQMRTVLDGAADVATLVAALPERALVAPRSPAMQEAAR